MEHQEHWSNLNINYEMLCEEYCQTYNISHTLSGSKIVDHSDVVGASSVCAVPTTSSFLAVTKQLYKWYFPSVRPSVCLSHLFTRGQFWPSGIVVACVCVCVCVCVCLSVNHQLLRAVTHQPFKLGSPNLDQRCKRPWLRSLLFCGVIDGDLPGQIELESQNLPHFWLVSLSGR